MKKSHNSHAYPFVKMLPVKVVRPSDGKPLTETERKVVKKHHNRKARKANKKLATTALLTD